MLTKENKGRSQASLTSPAHAIALVSPNFGHFSALKLGKIKAILKMLAKLAKNPRLTSLTSPTSPTSPLVLSNFNAIRAYGKLKLAKIKAVKSTSDVGERGELNIRLQNLGVRGAIHYFMIAGEIKNKIASASVIRF